jgi:ketosteroid isomerase-like protein
MADTPSILETNQLVSQLLQQLAARDADSIAKLFAETIDWYIPGNVSLPWVGRRTKSSEVVVYFTTLWNHLIPEKSIVALEKVIINGNDAIILAHFTHTAASTGRSFNTPAAIHIQVGEGKIIRLHLYEDTFSVSQAFLT